MAATFHKSCIKIRETAKRDVRESEVENSISLRISILQFYALAGIFSQQI